MQPNQENTKRTKWAKANASHDPQSMPVPNYSHTM